MDCVNSLKFDSLKGGLAHLPLRPMPAGADVMIVDSNIIGNTLWADIFWDYHFVNKDHIKNYKYAPIDFDVVDEHRLHRDREYSKQLISEGVITETQYFFYRANELSNYSSAGEFMNFLTENLEHRPNIQYRVTPTILTEVIGPEYEVQGLNAVWKGPRHVLHDNMSSTFFIRKPWLLSMTNTEPNELAKYNAKTQHAEVGGHKGVKDRAILAEIKFAQKNSMTQLSFATADFNFIRGILALHLKSRQIANELVQIIKSAKASELIGQSNITEVHDFTYNARFGDWRTQSVSLARMVVFKEIYYDENEKFDLYAFFTLQEACKNSTNPADCR